MSEDKAKLLIRIPASLKAKLLEHAHRDRRSLNRQIEYLLDQALRSAENVNASSIAPLGQVTKQGKRRGKLKS